MKTRNSLLILFPIIILFLVTAVCGISQSISQEGYKDGKQAAKVDWEREQTIYRPNIKVPDFRIQEISNKPESYKDGYIKGYKEKMRELKNSHPGNWLLILALVGAVGALTYGLLK